MTWWPWHRRDHNGHENHTASVARRQTEAREAATYKLTPLVERMADQVADLPAEEFADRVARAFRRRPA